MASLTAHLLEAGDHGRLGFHSCCPVCRQERLLGVLSSEAVVSRRAQAVLAGGVLAFSAASPVTAVAQEPDRQSEGVVAPLSPGGEDDPGSSDGTGSLGESDTPEPGTGLGAGETLGQTTSPGAGDAPGQTTSPGAGDAPGQTDSPDFDPGGETALPYEAAPPSSPQGATPLADQGDGAATEPEDLVLLESEPVDDADARLVPPSEPELRPSPDESDLAGESDVPVPPTESVGTVPPVEPDLVAPPSGAAPAPAVPESSSPLRVERQRRDSPGPNRRTEAKPHARAEHGSARPDAQGRFGATPPQRPTQTPAITIGGLVLPSPAPAPKITVPVSQPDTTEGTRVSTHRAERHRIKDRKVHVVQAGDSLWSIAKRTLDPSASPAQIAREVNRLWTLNENRIGTGYPDLLMVGTKLRLR